MTTSPTQPEHPVHAPISSGISPGELHDNTMTTAEPSPNHQAPIVPASKDEMQAFMSSLRTPADKKYFRALGSDGVFRICIYLPCADDEPTPIGVYDAKPMSPEQIKAYLDRRPWSQDLEDKYRGVDGRAVPEKELFEPNEGVLPDMGSKNERHEKIRLQKEEYAAIERKVEAGELEEDVLPKCRVVRSDFDLRPRGGDNREGNEKYA